MKHKDYFNDVAENYEWAIYNSYNRGFPNEGFYQMIDLFVRYFDVNETSEILDVGIGTGLVSEKFYEMGAKIFGIDYAEKMIEVARKKMPKARLICCDILEGLPQEFIRKKFDYIFVSFVFHLFPYEVQFNLIEKLLNYLKHSGMMILAGPAFSSIQDFLKIQSKKEVIMTPDMYYIFFDFYHGILDQMNLKYSFTQVTECCGFITIYNKSVI